MKKDGETMDGKATAEQPEAQPERPEEQTEEIFRAEELGEVLKKLGQAWPGCAVITEDKPVRRIDVRLRFAPGGRETCERIELCP